MNINLISHNDTEWEREVEITHNGKNYRLFITWARDHGYEIVRGWAELPDAIKDLYENDFDLACEIDEATYNKAYNKEGERA